MPHVEKDEVVRNILERLISISGRKTDKVYALMTMETLIKDLEPQFNFLKNIQINEDVYTEDTVSTVSLHSNFRDVPPNDLGKALHAIIFQLNRNLGNKAGHFFIKELRNTLSDDYLTTMREMGVDLGMMQLETEVSRLEQQVIYHKPEENYEDDNEDRER